MPAAATQNQVVNYTPRATSARAERDLILLEQKKWGAYCGVLTRARLARYLKDWFTGEAKTEEEMEAESPVDCCGYGGDLAIPLHVYEIEPGVGYRLLSTCGKLDEGVLETVAQKESVSFNMEREASISRPAVAVESARWLTGPWTTGGASVAAPVLTVSGRNVRAPIPLFGSVELTLKTRRWAHILSIPKDEVEALLIGGWAEFAVGLPDGGRPVALEIEEPPGAAELALLGLPCGGGSGGGSGRINTPDGDEPPKAQPEDKHIKCDYCELECEDPDKDE